MEQDEDNLQLPAYNEDEMIHMVHVALYLRNLILQHAPNNKSQLTEENTYDSVPKGLYIFMAIMHGGADILDTIDDGIEDEDNGGEDGSSTRYEKASKLRKSILDVCQDLTYIISGGKIIPPKQYSLGLTVHQLSGRNKQLVQ